LNKPENFTVKGSEDESDLYEDKLLIQSMEKKLTELGNSL
jgi:hypothetical protein